MKKTTTLTRWTFYQDERDYCVENAAFEVHSFCKRCCRSYRKTEIETKLNYLPHRLDDMDETVGGSKGRGDSSSPYRRSDVSVDPIRGDPDDVGRRNGNLPFDSEFRYVAADDESNGVEASHAVRSKRSCSMTKELDDADCRI